MSEEAYQEETAAVSLKLAQPHVRDVWEERMPLALEAALAVGCVASVAPAVRSRPLSEGYELTELQVHVRDHQCSPQLVLIPDTLCAHARIVRRPATLTAAASIESGHGVSASVSYTLLHVRSSPGCPAAHTGRLWYPAQFLVRAHVHSTCTCNLVRGQQGFLSWLSCLRSCAKTVACAEQDQHGVQLLGRQPPAEACSAVCFHGRGQGQGSLRASPPAYTKVPFICDLLP